VLALLKTGEFLWCHHCCRTQISTRSDR